MPNFSFLQLLKTFDILFFNSINIAEDYNGLDVAESRAINNRVNPFLRNFADTSYGNLLRGSANMPGRNQFQSDLVNQISNNRVQTGLYNGKNTHRLQNTFLHQGAKTINQSQAKLKLQQENQRLQYIRMLQQQQQQKQQREKLKKLQTTQLSNTYTANTHQNALFSKSNFNNRNVKPSNTYRKSDATHVLGQENAVQNSLGQYDYDADYYDIG